MLLHSDVEECGAAVNERSNFMNTFLNRNEALRTAWKKIQEYCSQYAGRSNQDVQVRWRHDMYGWTEFGVTPNGVPYIVHGDHSQDSRSSSAAWYFHPQHRTSAGDEFMRYSRMEEVISDWPRVKDCLARAFGREAEIWDVKV